MIAHSGAPARARDLGLALGNLRELQFFTALDELRHHENVSEDGDRMMSIVLPNRRHGAATRAPNAVPSQGRTSGWVLADARKVGWRLLAVRARGLNVRVS